jgi:hypothetical protein
MRALVLALLSLAARVLAGRCRAQAQGRRRGQVLPRLLAVLLALSVSPEAPAQQPPALDSPRGPRLEYTRGPTACLSLENFATELRMLMRAPLRTDAPDVVKVWCEKGPMGFTCRVQHVDASGKGGEIQRIDGWDCWRVGRETALAVAEIAGFNPAPKECPAPEPCPTCPPARPCRCPPERVCPLPPKPPKPWYHMDLGLYGLAILTGNLAADPGFALSVGADVRGTLPENLWTPVFSFGFELRVALPGKAYAREAFLPGEPFTPGSLSLSQYTALVVPCARWKYFFGCVPVQGGMYYAEGQTQAVQGTVAAGPRLGFRVPFAKRFAVVAFGEALFTPIKAGFVGPNNALWRPSVAQGYGAAAFEVTFQ